MKKHSLIPISRTFAEHFLEVALNGRKQKGKKPEGSLL